MDYEEISDKVAPNPSLPKTIGVLNLLFGGALLLCGLGCMSRVLPSLAQGEAIHVDPEEAQMAVDEIKQTEVDDLKKSEQAAKSDAEKARLREERFKLESSHTRVKDQIDFDRLNAALAWIPRCFWAEFISGPILNFLMLISGIGLLRLKRWGRVLGVWVSLLKVIRLVGLAVFLTVYVIPPVMGSIGDFMKTDAGKATLSKFKRVQGNQPAPASPEEIMDAINVVGPIAVITFTCLGVIYPLITLIVLTRRPAKLACESELANEGDFSG